MIYLFVPVSPQNTLFIQIYFQTPISPITIKHVVIGQILHFGIRLQQHELHQNFLGP